MHERAYPMDDIKIVNELKAKSILVKGSLSIECSKVRAIAKKFEVKGMDIRKLCDEEKIKIFSCELGCF